MFNDHEMEYEIVSLLLMPVIHKFDMVQRKNKLSVTGTDLNTIDNLIDVGNGKLHGGRLMSKLPNMYTMGKKADISKIAIDGGWGSERYAFVLELHASTVDPQTRSVIDTHVEFIQGYTNYDGAHEDAGGNVTVSDDMVFTINSVATAKMINVRGRRDPVIAPKAIFNLMCDSNGDARLVEDDDSYSILRPTDIVGTFGVEEDFGDSIPITNFNNKVTSNLIVPSKINNKIGARKLENILNAGLLVSSRGNDSKYNKYNQIAGSIREPEYDKIIFMNLISRGRNTYTVEFTPADLFDIDDGFEDVTDVPEVSVSEIVLKDKNPDKFREGCVLYSDKDLEDLRKPIEEARLASILSEELSAIIYEKRVNAVSFTLSTKLGFDRPVFTWVVLESAISIIDVELVGIQIEDDMLNYVLPKLTDGEEQHVDIMVHIDMLSISRVAISVDGYEYATFEIPIYANGLFDSNIIKSSLAEKELDSWKTLVDLTL